MEGTLLPDWDGSREGDSRTGFFGEGHLPAGRETRISFLDPAKGCSLHPRRIKRPWNSPRQVATKAVLMARRETKKTQGFSQEQLLSSAGAEKHKARVGVPQLGVGGRITPVAP